MTHPERTRWHAAVVTALASAGLVTAPTTATAANTQYYVDCSAPSAGTGTQTNPFNTVAAASALTLGAGDRVWFKRGTTCLGQYTAKGSGTSSAPVVIGAYGTATARPKIDANGAENAVRLDNVSHVTVQDLELTAPGDGTTVRRGLYAHAAAPTGATTDLTVTNVTLQRLYVHDVRGKMPSTVTGNYHGTGKYGNATGGIVVEAGDGPKRARFTDVDVLDNEVRSVDRQGIYFWSHWCRDTARPNGFPAESCAGTWYPHDDLLIDRNRLHDIGGDGIVPKTATNVLVQHNKVIGFNRRSASPNIALWSANTVGVTFQYNEAAGGYGTKDSQGFDVDHATDDTVFQYNYSHDNEGGFFLICPVTSNRNFTIRYNLSVDDRFRLFEVCAGNVTGGKIHNNTIVVGNGLTPLVVQQDNPNSVLDIAFRNNIVSKEDAGTLGWKLIAPGFVLDHNAFRNVEAHPNATGTTTAAHGLIAPTHHDPRAYHLSTTSALHGAGTPITTNGGLDYFGNPVPATGSPDIGAYEGPGTCTPAHSALFDTDPLSAPPSGWTATGSVSVVSRPVATFPSGEQGRSVQLARGATEASMTSTFSASNTIRVSLRVRADQTNAPLGVWLLDAAGGEVAKASLTASGRLGYTAAGSWQETGTYRAGEWYRLELLLDPTAGTYDVLLDGTPIATDAPLGPSTSPATRLKVRTQAGGTPTETFGVDDLLIRPC
ncbi:MAG: right-handed parallel beta-helix repeat-containing protein [Saccharothrix sp.]|nr:right-handed parallel beta-helix repeat-containing protein [Saccharothrix sp.]